MRNRHQRAGRLGLRRPVVESMLGRHKLLVGEDRDEMCTCRISNPSQMENSVRDTQAYVWEDFTSILLKGQLLVDEVRSSLRVSVLGGVLRGFILCDGFHCYWQTH